MTVQERTIADLPLAGAATRTHVLPSMKDGTTQVVSVGQVVDLAKSEVVGAAPAQLDTLDELAAALNDDANLAATLTAAIALKADASTTNINGLTAKTTPVDADELRIADSAAGFGFKKLTFANLKAWIATAARILFGTPVSVSGTAVDFTGLPAGVNRISIKLSGVSTNGTDAYRLQLGTSSGLETSAYAGASSALSASVATINDTAGFPLNVSSASALLHGTITLERLTGNQWTVSGCLGRSDNASMVLLAGSKSLAGALDRLRLTTSGGTSTFDAGTMNISWEF